MTKFDEIRVGVHQRDMHEKIRVAVANIAVVQDEVKASYLESPVLTRDRLTAFSRMLNNVASYRSSDGGRVNLVVFPEVSVPYSWQAMVVAWARRHDIGFIAGLEHRIDSKKNALNYVFAALPYLSPTGQRECVPVRRLKKFYSPHEIFELENQHLKIPGTEEVKFQLFRWRGASFAIYNCHELSSIEHRGIFKGKVDFIVATEFNRDVNYFSNIVEAVARDVHCFVVQVNDSQYGDSRVIVPGSTDVMNPVRIKGGENQTYLVSTLDLKGLRDHQRQGFGLQKESKQFKATPPGLRLSDVLSRIDFSFE